jgi:hypothetical protein
VETEKQIPDPLWPMPEGWEKPTIRLWTKPERQFRVWLPDLTGGGLSMDGFDTIGDAMDYARQENCEASKRTEYVERRETLARFLCDLVYGDGAWVEAESDLILNYRLDADDIIKANPHLLSLEERERLEHLIPELES